MEILIYDTIEFLNIRKVKSEDDITPKPAPIHHRIRLLVLRKGGMVNRTQSAVATTSLYSSNVGKGRKSPPRFSDDSTVDELVPPRRLVRKPILPR